MDAGWYETTSGRFKIDKVVGWYDVWTHGNLPFPKITFKVVETPKGSYIASSNVYVRNNGVIEYNCGVGKDVQSAVLNGIESFYGEVEKLESSTGVKSEVSDFVWMCWTPFGAEPFTDD